MSYVPDPDKKPVAERLAELLGVAEGAETLRLLQQLGLLATTEDAPRQDDPPRQLAEGEHWWAAFDEGEVRVFPSKQIGIWFPVESEGQVHYVRSAEGPERQFWADVERIPPKTSKPRIVFIGESVARGYFYDPYFNPAGVLQELLRRSGLDAEIVDLARTNLGFEELPLLVEASLSLRPDAVVVFAGNNWGVRPTTLAPAFPEILETLARGGRVADVRPILDRRLEEMTRGVIGQLGALSKREAIPAVVVLPEFNLVDWHACFELPAPFLPEGENARWIATYAAARRALEDRDYEKAAELSAQLSALDGGLTEAAAEIRARALLAKGPAPDARALLEAVRDAEVWNSTMHTPRCFSAIQRAMRAGAPREGIALVDLPQLFEDYLGGQLADRRMFHDYCHLSAEGMRVAMAGTAERLLPLLGAPARGWKDIDQADVRPTPEVEGQAHLLAALHNSHWRQPTEILRYHCRRAVELAPELAPGVMRQFLDFQTRAAPSVACAAFGSLLESNAASIRRFLLTYGVASKQKRLHLRLTDAMAEVLATTGDTDARARLDRLRREEHGITREEVDLLVETYQGEHDQSRHGVFRSLRPRSDFTVLCDGPTGFVLSLTCRLPEAPGEVRVSMNGDVVGSFAASERWGAFRVDVPASATVTGVNTLSLQWPVPAMLGKDGLLRLVSGEADGELHPVLAEVLSLKARGTSAPKPG